MIKMNGKCYAYDLRTRRLYRNGTRSFGYPLLDFPDYIDLHGFVNSVFDGTNTVPAIRVVTDHSTNYYTVEEFEMYYPHEVEIFCRMVEVLESHPEVPYVELKPRVEFREPAEQVERRRRRIW